MSDLSRRFEELIARMARTDAQLFRTIGEQNAALHRVADPVQHHRPSAALIDREAKPSIAALAAAGLLPREECNLNQLKKRFHTLAPARAFLEARLGAPPKGSGRFTWKLVQQTVETGQWPPGQPSGSHGGKPGSGGAMAAMEQRLQMRLERMEQRLKRLELLLLQALEQPSGAAAPPPS